MIFYNVLNEDWKRKEVLETLILLYKKGEGKFKSSSKQLEVFAWSWTQNIEKVS